MPSVGAWLASGIMRSSRLGGFPGNLKEGVFAFTATDRVRRDFKFCTQIRSASNSATDTISEGFYRYWSRDFARFLTMAQSSLGEVKNQLRHAREREYLDESKFNDLWTLARTLEP